MAVYTVQRLQTNSDWHAQFRFRNVDLTGWVIHGRAKSTRNSSKYVDLSIGGGQITIDDAADGLWSIVLSGNEAAALGEGTIQFEILRSTPTPVRPVLRFTIKNHVGV